MRILFVCMIDSITAVRWVSQLSGTGWDVHVFPSVRGSSIHPDWRDVTLHDVGFWRPVDLHESVRVAGLWPWRKGAYRMTRLAERLGLRRDRARLLAKTIELLRPNVVHSLEMQHAAYLTLDARRVRRGRFPVWIYSSWGSDLCNFRHDIVHNKRIRAVLESCDAMMADCERDLSLALELGFRGTSLGVYPGGGGFDLSRMALSRLDPPSKRRLIAVKGYQNDTYGGRALVALQAVHRCADVLGGYETVVYGAMNPEVHRVVSHIKAVSALNITGWRMVSHNEVLTLLGRSRVHLALSTTDGTPNAMLEAMIMGALPIQSDSVSTGEWIDNRRNGLLVKPEDPVAVEEVLRLALRDDTLVDQASGRNTEIAQKRLDREAIMKTVMGAYDKMDRRRLSTGAPAQ